MEILKEECNMQQIKQTRPNSWLKSINAMYICYVFLHDSL